VGASNDEKERLFFLRSPKSRSARLCLSLFLHALSFTDKEREVKRQRKRTKEKPLFSLLRNEGKETKRLSREKERNVRRSFFVPFFAFFLLLLLPTSTTTRSSRARGLPRPQPVELRVTVFERVTSESFSIRGQVRPPQILQKLPPPRQHHLQPPRRTLILPVDPEVCCQRADSL